MIGIGSDHGGYDLKMAVISYLDEQGIEYKDYGCMDKNSCDYPIYGKAVAEAVSDGTCEKGIVICTTGIGISMVANKIPGIRCALCSDTISAKLTRLHNDANMLAMGGGIIGNNLALSIIDAFLHTEFSAEEKHQRRVNMINEIL